MTTSIALSDEEQYKALKDLRIYTGPVIVGSLFLISVTRIYLKFLLLAFGIFFSSKHKLSIQLELSLIEFRLQNYNTELVLDRITIYKNELKRTLSGTLAYTRLFINPNKKDKKDQ